MAKVITQETFDDVVKENIIEFAMTTQDAKSETIEQFEAQGINLANIIKDLTINEETGVPVINEAIDQLKAHISGTSEITEAFLLNCLQLLKSECDKTVPHRVLAATNGASAVLLTILEKELDSSDSTNFEVIYKINIYLVIIFIFQSLCLIQQILTNALLAIISLITKQPDVFDAETLVVSIKIFEKQQASDNLIVHVLRLLSKACVMHEINRQNIMNADIMIYLKPLVESDNLEVRTYLKQK